MTDFIESNSLIATDEVMLATTALPVRGSADWLAALSEEVTHELSDSLARQKTAKEVGGSALCELDAVIGSMRSHTTHVPHAPRAAGSAPVSAFKPSALAAYGLKSMAEEAVAKEAVAKEVVAKEVVAEEVAAEEVALVSEPSHLSDLAQSSAPQSSDSPVSVADSVRASWPVNWSVLRVPDFQLPRLKVRDGGNPSPSV